MGRLNQTDSLAAFTVTRFGCTTVRQLREPSTISPDGRAQKTRVKHALDYSVATLISAPPEVVWNILTDGAAYPQWNSTIVKLDGEVAQGSRIRLVAKVAPKRTFKLKVSAFEAPRRMVWEDGGSIFLGVRTFTLTPRSDGGTTFTMSETLSGGMLGMIERSLPDFTASFEAFAADLKQRAERPE
jgi:uncharacterized protein YndB with AHSA1/START domain